MTSYRIKRITDENGKHHYFPQRKGLFFWRTLTDGHFECPESLHFYSRIDALQAIKDEVKDRRSNICLETHFEYFNF